MKKSRPVVIATLLTLALSITSTNTSEAKSLDIDYNGYTNPAIMGECLIDSENEYINSKRKTPYTYNLGMFFLSTKTMEVLETEMELEIYKLEDGFKRKQLIQDKEVGNYTKSLQKNLGDGKITSREKKIINQYNLDSDKVIGYLITNKQKYKKEYDNYINEMAKIDSLEGKREFVDTTLKTNHTKHLRNQALWYNSLINLVMAYAIWKGFKYFNPISNRLRLMKTFSIIPFGLAIVFAGIVGLLQRI